MQFNALWTVHAKREPWECFVGQCFLQEHFLRRGGTGKQTEFSLSSIPSGRTTGECTLPGAEEKTVTILPVQLLHKDVSPSPASPAGNTLVHARDMSVATEAVLVQLQAEMEMCNPYHKARNAKNTCKTNTPAFFCKDKEKKEQKRQNLWLSALKMFQADVASQP